MAVVAKLGWKVVAGVAGAIVASVTRSAIDDAWRSVRGTAPPEDPTHRSVALTDAISWTIATTAGLAVARLVTDRVVARGWEVAFGTPAPGHEPAPAPVDRRAAR